MSSQFPQANLEIQLHPDSLATHFIVRDTDGDEREVDTNPEPP